DDRVLDLTKAQAKAREEKVAAEIQTKSLQDRNEQLLRQVEDLTKEIAKMRMKVAVIPPKTNAPPKDVEGVIMQAAGDLVTISIGSDSGLEKGHTLEVYRLKPAPQYIGQIKIVDVRARDAVGKFVEKPKTPVQKGDTVASELLPREKK